MSALAHTSGFAYHHQAPRATRQPGRFRQLLNRYLQWRQHRVEQDIAIRLGLTGGRLTDEIERRMMERLTRGGGFRG
jgi:hypothetical protein